MSEKISVITVGAKRNGYRRAGLQFGEAAATIPLSALTSHQVKELRTDRMLVTNTTDAFVLGVLEHDDLRRKEAIVDELTSLLPCDFTWTRTPVEYVANLLEQVRVQTERANSLQSNCDTLRTQADELQAKISAKSEASRSASKTTHNAGAARS